MLTYQDQIILVTAGYSLEAYGKTNILLAQEICPGCLQKVRICTPRAISATRVGTQVAVLHAGVRCQTLHLFDRYCRLKQRQDCPPGMQPLRRPLHVHQRHHVAGDNQQQARGRVLAVLQISIDSKGRCRSSRTRPTGHRRHPGCWSSFFTASTENDYDNYVMFLAAQLSCLGLFLAVNSGSGIRDDSVPDDGLVRFSVGI
ncbi:hypothetical protein SS50377_28686 [Spironucleus salmonicida]|uniref:Uncharacterized protein n=1 Tax=Spironucleus salmonicida TaxID=348837 RepID=A0A9P8LKP1_9EUKA|nr:hypothetical protein SS50377_28686 [Spironucleus salmonicida]